MFFLFVYAPDYDRCCFVKAPKEGNWRASCQIDGWPGFLLPFFILFFLNFFVWLKMDTILFS
jgi:hypothetical protein